MKKWAISLTILNKKKHLPTLFFQSIQFNNCWTISGKTIIIVYRVFKNCKKTSSIGEIRPKMLNSLLSHPDKALI